MCSCCDHPLGTEIHEGHDAGRDPRKMAPDELRSLGHEPMPASKAIRLRCLDCCAGNAAEVRRCRLSRCPSYPVRMGGGGGSKLKVIRAHCLDCCNGSALEVRLCTAVKCAHWPFRMGSSPWNSRPYAANDGEPAGGGAFDGAGLMPL